MEDTIDNTPVFTELSPAVIKNEDGALTDVKVPFVKAEYESSDDSFRNGNTELVIDMATQAQQVFNKLVVLYRGLPKEMFVNRVLLNEASCEVTLENYRKTLFEEIRESDTFPYGLQCELKRRVNTRNGDTVAVKLAYDIHTLMSIMEGGEYSDMKDMIRPGRATRAVSTPVRGNSTIQHCEYSAEIKSLIHDMITVKAELLNTKQKHVAIESARSSEIQALKLSIASLKSDFHLLSTTMSKFMTNIKLATERIESDKSMGVVQLKNEFRLMRQNMKTLEDTVDLFEDSLASVRHTSSAKPASSSKKNRKSQHSDTGTNGMNNLQSVEVSRCGVSELTGANPQISVHSDANSNVSESCSVSVDNQCGNNEGLAPVQNAVCGEEADTTACNPQTALMNTSVGQMNQSDVWLAEAVEHRPNVNIPSHVNSPVVELSRNETGTDNCHTMNTVTRVQDSIVSPQSPTTAVHTALYSEVAGTYSGSGRNRKEIGQFSHRVFDVSESASSYTGYDNASRTLLPVRAPDGSLPSVNAKNIPVRTSFQSRQNVDAAHLESATVLSEVGSIEDEDFIKYIRKRPKRYYLGGFTSGITESAIEQYVRKRHGPTVTWVSIWRSRRDRDSVVIRLNVEDNEYTNLIESSRFWPRGVICRPWYDRTDDRSRNRRDFNQHARYNYYGRSDVDEYNPFSPLRDGANLD